MYLRILPLQMTRPTKPQGLVIPKQWMQHKTMSLLSWLVAVFATTILLAISGCGGGGGEESTPIVPMSPPELLPNRTTYTGEMIDIPAGAFLMGTPESYTGIHAANEHPQHSVTLAAYSIGKYEVTIAEFRVFIEAGGYSTPAYWSTDGWTWKGDRTKPSDWDGLTMTQPDSYPMTGVNYYEAEAFCNWAGGRLPTEAEWEKAARWNGSESNIYPWGNIQNIEKCNNFYDGLYTDTTRPCPVGSFPSGASPYGCMDMAGNVDEWCKDWYSETYYSESPASDPQGPASGGDRVRRGGNFGSGYSSCAAMPFFSSFRGYLYGGYGSDLTSQWFGFRFAR